MQITDEKRTEVKMTRILRGLILNESCAEFSVDKRAVVDSTASRLKKKERYEFEVRRVGDIIKVWKVKDPTVLSVNKATLQ